MKKLYFITGSQDLYGEETLAQAEKDSKAMTEFLNGRLKDTAAVEFAPIVKTAAEAEKSIMMMPASRRAWDWLVVM